MSVAELRIRELFNTYRDCFNRLDGRGAAAHYTTPSFVVKAGSVVRIDAQTKVGYFDSLVSGNASEGEHVWEIAGLDILQPAPNGAIVTVHWIARRPDRSILWDFLDSYIVADDGSGWLIQGDIVHHAL